MSYGYYPSQQHQLPATRPSPTDPNFLSLQPSMPSYPTDMDIHLSNSEGEEEMVSDYPRRECVKRALTAIHHIDVLLPEHEQSFQDTPAPYSPPSPPRPGRYPTRFDDDLARASNAAMNTLSDPRVDQAVFPPPSPGHPTRRVSSRYSPGFDEVTPQQTGFISSLHSAYHGPPTGQYTAPYYPRSPSYYDRDEYAADIEDGDNGDERNIRDLESHMNAMHIRGHPSSSYNPHRIRRHGHGNGQRRHASRRSRDRP